MGMIINPSHIKAERSVTPTYPIVDTFFDATVREFEFYIANCHETGTYSAFYTMTDAKTTKGT
jgi:hypothetical protein